MGHGSSLASLLLRPSSHSFLSDIWLDKRATGQELIVTKVITSALLSHAHTHTLSDHLCSQGSTRSLHDVAKAPPPPPHAAATKVTGPLDSRSGLSGLRRMRGDSPAAS